MLTVSEDTWRHRASCRGMPASWWIAGDGRSENGTSRARTICASCPVRQPCAAYALQLVHEGGFRVMGTWAGVSVSGPRRRAIARLVAVANED